MPSQLSSDDDHIQPSDRVVDLEQRVNTEISADFLRSLGVFVRHLDPRSVIGTTSNFDRHMTPISNPNPPVWASLSAGRP